MTTMPVSLNDSIAEGDIDLANKRAHVTGGVPGIPGLSGEMIVIDPYVYVRTYGQTKYAASGNTTIPFNPALSGGTSPVWLVGQIVALANSADLSPVLVGTENDGGVATYHIRVDVTKEVATQALKSVGQAFGTGNLELWITQDGFQIERLEFSTSDPTFGAAVFRLVCSNWNNVSQINAPNPDDFEIPALQSYDVQQ
jgi:hypothetical protein